ncbi:hypothetical protein JYU14_02020 [Simkania negevensis]|uniref:Uncharacterized protein n=1 Tax=Simkania negevensis TaxID=83561 RepID=A0ABS3ATK4_9BACT|nr:hypothetical protein [Simkania negevensis]
MNYHKGDEGLVRPMKALGRFVVSFVLLEATSIVGAIYNLGCAIGKGAFAAAACIKKEPLYGRTAKELGSSALKHLAAVVSDLATAMFSNWVSLFYTILPSYTIAHANNRFEQWLGTKDDELKTLPETSAIYTPRARV